MESIAPEWGLTRVPFKAEADVGKRWGISRNPNYDYHNKRFIREPYEDAATGSWKLRKEAA
jgi:hypothetical protein